VFEKAAFSRGRVPDYKQVSCGCVVRTGARFTDPDGQTVFLIIDNEFALLITTAIG
jgi:hypothetical protein